MDIKGSLTLFVRATCSEGPRHFTFHYSWLLPSPAGLSPSVQQISISSGDVAALPQCVCRVVCLCALGVGDVGRENTQNGVRPVWSLAGSATPRLFFFLLLLSPWSCAHLFIPATRVNHCAAAVRQARRDRRKLLRHLVLPALKPGEGVGGP